MISFAVSTAVMCLSVCILTFLLHVLQWDYCTWTHIDIDVKMTGLEALINCISA